MSNVLTNNTGGSIVLTLNKVTSPEANVISMAPGESLLYSEVIVSDETDPNYNVPLIQEYVDAGILLNQEVSGYTSSQLQLMSQGNTVVDFTTGTPHMLSKAVTTGIDNLQVLPVSNITGNLQYVYYKSVQGMSVSMDFGKSQLLINNANLLYPDEITSFAVQVYESIAGVLHPVNRLYIGTLREGVKTFTPGIDTTYVNFDEDASFNITSPIFKNSLKITVAPLEYVYTFPTFCPTYVLAIINNPYTAGCPIFIASRTMQTVDADPAIYQTKVVYKYLHSQIYVNNVLTTIDPNSWFLLQENTTSYTTLTFPQHILDVITEYIPTGAFIAIKSSDSPSNKLYKIYCVPNAATIPTITEIALDSNLQNVKIKNLSYLSEIGSSNYNVFITLDSQVWRYASINTTWSLLLYSGATPPYFDTAITNGVLTSGGTTYLKELSGFVVFPKNNTANSYIALLSSEIGLILYSLNLVNNVFVAGAKVTRTLLNNVARFPISDIKTIIYGENLYLFTSSYSSQIPRTYYNNTNCFHLVDNDLSLIQDVYYLKPDTESSNYPYYVTENATQINAIPSSEQLSYSPVLINADYSYTLNSAKYTFKLKSLATDDVLVTALTNSLAYKYYFPYITERIVSSISPAELSVLELNDYKHSIRANITAINILPGLLGNSVSVSNQQTITLPGVYLYDDFSGNYTSFLCVSSDNSVVLPTSISTTKNTSLEFTSYVTFDSPFSGTIYMHVSSEGPIPFSVNGLFAILDYSNSATYPSLYGQYPQVSLDSSVFGLLNDIRYIDSKRLEISFTSAVNTTIFLI